MKSLQLAFLLLFFSLAAPAKAQTDPSLKRRLTEYMALTRSLNFDSLMNYIHPKLFSIAPREQMVAVMKSTFQGDEDIEIRLDSMETGTISKPFIAEGGTYTKIAYSMLIRLRMKEEDPEKQANSMMMSLFQSQYGKENVRYDAGTRFYMIRIQTFMVGVKDSESPEWTFLNFKPEDAITARLLPKAVIEQLKQL